MKGSPSLDEGEEESKFILPVPKQQQQPQEEVALPASSLRFTNAEGESLSISDMQKVRVLKSPSSSSPRGHIELLLHGKSSRCFVLEVRMKEVAAGRNLM